MASLSFPDVNVWLAVLLSDHVHRAAAKQWWNSDAADAIAFSRFTQISVLRLLTTSAAMNGNPLTMKQAWKAYDQLYLDDRVCLLSEPPSIEEKFRALSASGTTSPKVWADAYILAFASAVEATVVTFDRALKNRGIRCLVLS